MGSSKYPLAQFLSVEFPQDFRLKLWLAGYIFWRQPLMDFYLNKIDSQPKSTTDMVKVRNGKAIDMLDLKFEPWWKWFVSTYKTSDSLWPQELLRGSRSHKSTHLPRTCCFLLLIWSWSSIPVTPVGWKNLRASSLTEGKDVPWKKGHFLPFLETQLLFQKWSLARLAAWSHKKVVNVQVVYFNHATETLSLRMNR